MKKKDRKPNEISAGAMADIAFLLLVFFFVCTAIIDEEGILVQLPPYEINDPPPIPKKNIFTLLVNDDDQLMANGIVMPIESLNAALKNFTLNPFNEPDKPSKPSKAVVSLQCNRGTSYDTYIQVYNELKKGYNLMWREHALKTFDKPYHTLSKIEQKEIRKSIPLLISEAESTLTAEK